MYIVPQHLCTQKTSVTIVSQFFLNFAAHFSLCKQAGEPAWRKWEPTEKVIQQVSEKENNIYNNQVFSCLRF